jgi:hypothetical protein
MDSFSRVGTLRNPTKEINPMSSIVRQRVVFFSSRSFVRLWFALLLCAVPLLAQTPGFTSFDAPHAGTLFNTGTFVAKINASGMIAGYYRDTS